MQPRTAITVTCLAAGLFLPGAAQAQPQIDWYTIDGGGGTSSGGNFSLTGTIGQPDAGTVTGGTFEARCGFWGAAGAACAADFDGNGLIQPADIAVFVNAWFASATGGGLAGDFDHNGLIEPADIAIFVNSWFAALTSGC